jgi:hypothetical protein
LFSENINLNVNKQISKDIDNKKTVLHDSEIKASMLISCDEDIIDKLNLSDRSSRGKSVSSNSPNYSTQMSEHYNTLCSCEKSIAQTSKSSSKPESKTIYISFSESEGPTEYRGNRSGRNPSITSSKTVFNHHNNCYCCIKDDSNEIHNENDFISRRHSLNSFQTYSHVHSNESSRKNEASISKNKSRSTSAKHVLFKNFLRPVVNISFLKPNSLDSKNPNEEFSKEKPNAPIEFKQYAKVTLKSYSNKNVVASNKHSHRNIKNR